MILQALNEYYQRKTQDGGTDLAPPGFEKKEIPFVIVLNEAGRFVDLEDTREGEGKKKIGRIFEVPQGEKKTSGILANLLWDNLGYVLGVVGAAKAEKLDAAKLEKEKQRTLEMHAAFLRRIRDTFPDPNIDPGVKAVVAFLERAEFEAVYRHPQWQELYQSTGNVSFRLEIDLQLVCQRKAVRQTVLQSEQDQEGARQCCLVTGEQDAIARLHPPIKGVWGAQTSGANIVSFNFEAAESYGKRKLQGLNAPVGERAAFAYTTALNHLLRKGSRQRVQVADASTVFWAEKSHPVEDQLLDWLEPPQDDPAANTAAVLSLYKSPWTGAAPIEEDETRFYVLGLAPNAARIAIRFWHRGTVGELARHIRQHFDDIEIVRHPQQPPYLSVDRLLTAIALFSKRENIPPNLAGEFMKSILAGTAYPRTLLSTAIRRVRAERQITYPRAALIKAALVRNSRIKGKQQEVNVSLDEKNTNIGYRLGRLFAALEYVQVCAARPRTLDATIRDRMYSAASATPMIVFPRLMRLKNHHLEQIQEKGLKIWLEGIIGQVVDSIDHFPAHLNLDDQGRFAIGYYHQRQAFYTKKDAKTAQEDLA